MPGNVPSEKCLALRATKYAGQWSRPCPTCSTAFISLFSFCRTRCCHNVCSAKSEKIPSTLTAWSSVSRERKKKAFCQYSLMHTRFVKKGTPVNLTVPLMGFDCSVITVGSVFGHGRRKREPGIPLRPENPPWP